MVLGLDELEAIRLADLLGLYHEEAAEHMGVSRATFGRILESARKKVAEALVFGKGLRIGGGHVEFVGPPGHGHCQRWGQKGGGRMAGWRGGLGMGPGGFCVCLSCGFRKPHEAGVPCAQEQCPHCGTPLVREGWPHRRQSMDQGSKEEK